MLGRAGGPAQLGPSLAGRHSKRPTCARPDVQPAARSGAHRRRRLARTEARREAATSGPRPAPTTISTVTRLSASSCAAGAGRGQGAACDCWAGVCSLWLGASCAPALPAFPALPNSCVAHASMTSLRTQARRAHLGHAVQQAAVHSLLVRRVPADAFQWQQQLVAVVGRSGGGDSAAHPGRAARRRLLPPQLRGGGQTPLAQRSA